MAQNPHHNITHDHHHHHPEFRFCPRCGGDLSRQSVEVSGPKRLVCRVCAFVFYEDPKLSACTIPVLDGKVVLLKRGIEPAYGKWVFPGGFVDRGERVEEAAMRETKEEVDLEVSVRRLLNVYSYPGYPVVVVVYTADVIGGQLAARDETLEVRAFAPEEIPWQELAFPSTKDALRDYLYYLAAGSS